jgi:hypothetical protein
MHLPKLAAVGTLDFARPVKGRRGSNSIAEEQTRIWPGTIMVRAGRPQLGSSSVMDQADMRKLEFQVGPVRLSHSADADQRLDHSGPAGMCQTQPRKPSMVLHSLGPRGTAPAASVESVPRPGVALETCFVADRTDDNQRRPSRARGTANLKSESRGRGWRTRKTPETRDSDRLPDTASGRLTAVSCQYGALATTPRAL